ncbi:MAG: hypothetical protein ACTHMG_17105 [Sphingomonas sp.]
MTQPLRLFVQERLRAAVGPEIKAAARIIADRLNGVAVLFYGSVLRTGDLDGLLDFYVLTEHQPGRGMRGLVSRALWPDISFEEVQIGGHRLRAKVATMPLDTFAAAAGGTFVDTTIWTRFVQPSALVWTADAGAAQRVIDAVAAAAITAARFAAVLGPVEGQPNDYWRALFRETYSAELRVERPGRENQILAYDPDRYARMLQLAWQADDIDFSERGGRVSPQIDLQRCHEITQTWLARRRLGKTLNAARLIKAAVLLDGAARYAVWKIQRHTGVAIPLTPWREHHPLLAAPGVLWKVWRGAGSTR